jgi:Immunity protein 26
MQKPKDQPFTVGDVFAVPRPGGFAFGRVIRLHKARGMYVEIFREASEDKAYKPSIVESGRLFQPVRLSGGNQSLKNWRWTVIHSDPGYAMPAEDGALEYSAPHPVGGGWAAVSLDGKLLRRVTDAEAKKMTDSKFWSPEDVEERIEAALGPKRPAKKR